MAVGFTPLSIAAPSSFVTAPDGSFWFLPRTSGDPNVATDQIGRIAGGFTSELTVPSHGLVKQLAEGPDGAIWFAESAPDPADPSRSIGKIGRVSASGAIGEYALPAGPNSSYVKVPGDIEAGPGGDVWFVEELVGTPGEAPQTLIARITPTGRVTEFNAPGALSPLVYSVATRIAGGADGDLYYTEPGAGKIGRISPSGAVSQLSVPGGASAVTITAGPDGNVWFTATNGVGRITPAGVITVFAAPGSFGDAYDYGGHYDLGSITAGPDGNVWFTESGGIAKVTPAGVITEYETPVFDMLPATIGVGPKGSLLLSYFYDAGRFTDVVLNPTTAPAATATAEAATQDESVATKVVHFAATDPLASRSDYRATIRWSSGYAASGIIVASPSGGFDVYASVAGSPLSSRTGPDPATITIFDTRAGGASTATVTGSLVVTANPVGVATAPVVTYAPMGAVTATSTIEVDGVLPATAYSATVTFGDGSPAVAATVTAKTVLVRTSDPGFSYYATTFTATVNHTYSRPGASIVTVAFLDKTGVVDSNVTLVVEGG